MAKNDKTMIIMRGLSGSGKSTLAKHLGKEGQVFSTDNFFMAHGEYCFNRDMLGVAHLWNQNKVRDAAAKGVTPIVVDNTNVTYQEMLPYLGIAQAYGYKVSYAEPDTPWKFDVDELVKRNTHNVPKDVIQKMVDKWEPTESLGMEKTANMNIDTTGFAKAGKLTEDEKYIFNIFMNVVRKFFPTTTIRAVGGWTRDKLMGYTPKDLDIMVDNIGGTEFANAITQYLGLNDPHVIRNNPEQSKNVETSRIYIPIPSGAQYEIDVAKARQDVYEGDSRIPTIVPATPQEDASRRDLTINSVFYNINTDQIEDFTNKGIEDIQNHIIRTPLEPVKTFSDDPLRMMRTIRFAARYGWDIDDTVKQALFSSNLREKLITKVSRERKGIELKEMLSSGHPDIAVALLLDSGIFEDMLTGAVEGSDRSGKLSNTLMDQNNPHHDLNWAEHTKALARGIARKYQGKDKDKVFQVMMASLLHDVGKLDPASRQQKDDRTTYHGHEDVSKEIAEAFMKFVKLEPFSKPVEALVGSHMRPHALIRYDSNKTAIRRFVRQMAELGIDWNDVVNLASADAMAKGKKPAEGTAEAYAQLASAGEEVSKTMPVSQGKGIKPVLNGNDIMEHFGIKEGAFVGQVLKVVKEIMDENPLITKEEALIKLDEMFPQMEAQTKKDWLSKGMASEAIVKSQSN